MKVKQDFVTNSSSVSHLVVIPDSFDPKKYFDKFMDKVIAYDEDLDAQDLDTMDELQLNEKGFADRVDKLARGITLYAYDDNMVYPLSDLFNELGLILSSLDSGPDETTLVGIDARLIQTLTERFTIIDSQKGEKFDESQIGFRDEQL